MACGGYHTLAISSNQSSVYSWGSKQFGQLGRETNQPYLPGIVDLPANEPVTMVREMVRAELQKQGSVPMKENPAIIQERLLLYVLCSYLFASELTNQKVACGENHSLLLTLDGRVYAFGCNQQNQLGISVSSKHCIQPQVYYKMRHILYSLLLYHPHFHSLYLSLLSLSVFCVCVCVCLINFQEPSQVGYRSFQ